MQSGVYVIRNTRNQKQYIGSSANIKKRWGAHLSDLRCGQHSNQHLQRAFDKYGESAFIFSVLEDVEECAQLIPREQYYLDTLSPEYNIAPAAGSRLGCHHSAEARARMSAAHMGHAVSDEQRRKQSVAMMGERNPNFGKPITAERRQKLSEACKGKYPSKETRRKMSLAQKARKRNGMYNKHHNEKTKQKMREAAMRLWSDETHRQRMRESAKRGWIHRKQRQKMNA